MGCGSGSRFHCTGRERGTAGGDPWTAVSRQLAAASGQLPIGQFRLQAVLEKRPPRLTRFFGKSAFWGGTGEASEGNSAGKRGHKSRFMPIGGTARTGARFLRPGAAGRRSGDAAGVQGEGAWGPGPGDAVDAFGVVDDSAAGRLVAAGSEGDGREGDRSGRETGDRPFRGVQSGAIGEGGYDYAVAAAADGAGDGLPAGVRDCTARGAFEELALDRLGQKIFANTYRLAER